VGKRVIVRTMSNVTYIGEVSNQNLFHEQGIAVRPNPELAMEIFVPEEEVREIIFEVNSLTYREFMKLL